MRIQTGMRDDGREPDGQLGTDADLEQALRNFRSSVHAWSEAAYSQARPAAVVRHVSWRLAAGWALGCVLAVGSMAGGVYEHRHRQELARMAAAAEAAKQQKLALEQRTPKDDEEKDDEDLLAKVDSDVSRQVPSAMEPLAQMMGEDTAK